MRAASLALLIVMIVTGLPVGAEEPARSPASASPMLDQPSSAMRQDRRRLQLAQYMAYACVTPYGVCPLAYPLPYGASCYCPSVYGPVWGVAR